MWIVEFYARIHGFSPVVLETAFTVHRSRWNVAVEIISACICAELITVVDPSPHIPIPMLVPTDLSLVSVSRLNCICSTSTIRLAQGEQQEAAACRGRLPNGARRIKPN